MVKIVYNACFGGFSLSRAAVLLGRELSGNPRWADAYIKGDVFPCGTPCDYDYGHISGLPRYDPILVRVVEQLGAGANRRCAELKVRELPSGTPYRISEYDGRETIETADSMDWTIAT